MRREDFVRVFPALKGRAKFRSTLRVESTWSEILFVCRTSREVHYADRQTENSELPPQTAQHPEHGPIHGRDARATLTEGAKRFARSRSRLLDSNDAAVQEFLDHAQAVGFPK